MRFAASWEAALGQGSVALGLIIVFGAAVQSWAAPLGVELPASRSFMSATERTSIFNLNPEEKTFIALQNRCRSGGRIFVGVLSDLDCVRNDFLGAVSSTIWNQNRGPHKIVPLRNLDRTFGPFADTDLGGGGFYAGWCSPIVSNRILEIIVRNFSGRVRRPSRCVCWPTTAICWCKKGDR
jgi:hypothetical protein